MWPLGDECSHGSFTFQIKCGLTNSIVGSLCCDLGTCHALLTLFAMLALWLGPPISL